MGDGSHLLKHVRRLAAGAECPDAGLVRRFAATADPEAFAEIVRRHGPAVLGVCRRVLGNDADADDAFQAAFLVLARKAGSVRSRRAVGGWLYGVARHVAVRLRDKNARRHRHERAAAARSAAGAGAAGPDGDLRAVLDDELARLPERERAAVLACLVRGLTQEGAAAELGWSLSTLRRRLEWGRELLRVRLARRLGEVPAGLLAGGAVVVPPALSGATVDSAVSFAAGARLGTPAAVLATGELAMMTRAKLAVLAGAAVAAAGLAVGAGTLWPAAHADDPKPAAKAADPAAKPETPAATPAADDRIRPGDRLRIIAGGGSLTEPPATGVIVEPSGQVPLGGWYGRVKVAGLTPEEAEAAIVEHLKKWHGGEGQWAQVVRWGQFPIDPGAPGVGLLEDRVRKLEQEVAELKKAVDELRKK